MKYRNDNWQLLNTAKTGGIGGGHYWTMEKCKEEALKYKTKTEYRVNSVSSYGAAHRNNWIDDICKHMIKLHKDKNYWTKEKCQEESLKYSSRENFRRGCSSAYNKSYDNKWLNDICCHMIKS